MAYSFILDKESALRVTNTACWRETTEWRSEERVRSQGTGEARLK
jgi:hypothetical protein